MASPDSHRVCLTVHYDGGGYFGWQVQPGRRTVQGELERVRLLGLVIALVATHARLSERLAAHLEVA